MRVELKKPGLVWLLGGLCAATSACAGGDGRYPSLALRPFETGVPAAALPSPATPIRPAVSAAALNTLRDRAMAAHAAFLEQQPVAARIARGAAGQSVESDARAAALVALADLSSRRGATASVLADLDLLTVEAATALSPDPALAAVQGEVAALVRNQDAAMAQLWEVMGQ